MSGPAIEALLLNAPMPLLSREQRDCTKIDDAIAVPTDGFGKLNNWDR
jgi:hypothetical protein